MAARRCLARLLAAALLLLAAGCELRATVDVDVEDDGAGRLAVTLEADEELTARAAAQPIDPLDQLADVGRELSPDWQADERATDDGGRAVTLAAHFDDPGELERLSAALAEALAAPELDPLDGFAVAVDRDRVRVSGTAALEPTAEVADFGLDPPAAVARLSEVVDYEVRVRMAGEVLDTTSDERDDGALTWQVPAGGSVEVVAVASRQRGPSPEVIAAGVVAAAALAAAVGWWARRRTRRG